MHCKISQIEKSSVNKEDFRLKWDLMWQKPCLNLLKLKFNSIQFGPICFRINFLMSLSLFNRPGVAGAVL